MFKEIRKLNKQGYKNIAGIDEAGRGPLAGPVVACAVFFHFSPPPQMRRGLRGGVRKNISTPLRPAPANWRGGGTSPHLRGGFFSDIRDSKKLSAKQREEWYKILTECSNLEWGVGIVSEKIIDKINILEATKLAMRKAVRGLENKLECRHPELVSGSQKRCRNKFGMTRLGFGMMNSKIDYLIIDGNFILNDKNLADVEQKAIVKADEKIFLCAAASIIAKVTRDRIMLKMHKKYPQFGFVRHKGYGTKEHLRALKKYGPCGIHRKSFGPVKRIIKN